MPEKLDTNATHVLANDHRTVEGLFSRYEKASSSRDKAEIARQICLELKVHTLIEEQVFYPALRGKIDDDTLDEAYVEHDGAKALVSAIEGGNPDEDFYDAKVTVLREQIAHHVAEEEKKADNMFQQARAAGVDLEALGEQLLELKEKLKAQAEAGTLPMETTTM